MANTDGSIHIDTKVDDEGLLSGLDGLSSKAKGAVSGIMKVIAAAGTAIAGVGAYALKVGMDFETAMSQVAATMGTTVDSIPDLTAFAQEMGATTQFSATQAAEALNYLAQAGYDAEKQMETLPTVLDLAAAGSMALGNAADLVADTMSALGMSTDDVVGFSNKLAYAAAATNTSVSGLGESMLECAGFGKTTGQSLNTMTAALGLMANNGIKGSEAGHMLQRVMKNLYTPTDQAAKAMKQLGVSAYNADGSARQMNEVISDLGKKLAGMTEQQKAAYMQEIFNVESLAGASALLKDVDSQWDEIYGGIESCTNETTEAADMAAVMLDNLKGDWTLLKSAAEGFGIALYNQVNGPLREITQLGAEIVSDMTKALQTEGLSGLGGALGNALAKATTKIASYAPSLVSSAVDLIKSLVQGIETAIPEVSDAIAGVFENLVTGIFDILPTFVDAGGKLTISLAQGLTKKAPIILKSMKDSVKSLVSTVTKLAPDMVAAGKDLLVSLGEGIEENLPDITTSLLEGLLSVCKSIVSMKTQLIKTGGQIVKAIGQGIINFIPTLVDNLPEVIDLIVEFFVTKYETIATVGSDLLSSLITKLPEVIKKIGQKLPQIIKGIVSRLGDFAGTIAEAGAQLLSAIFTNLPEILSGIWEALKGVDWIGLGKQLLDSLLSAFGTIGESLSKLIGDALPSLGDLDWGSIGTSIMGALGGIGSWIAGLFCFGKDSAKKLSWSEIGTSVLDGVGTVLDAGGTFLSGVFGSGKTLIEGMPWGDIGTIIDTGIKGVLDVGGAFLTGGFTAAKVAIEEIDWANLGTTIGSAINQTIDTAGAFLSGCFTAAKAAIEEIDWKNLGKVIGTAVNEFIDTAGAFLSGCFTAAKSAIEAIDWNNLGTVIGNGVNSAIDTAGAFLTGCFTAAKSAIETVDWANIGNVIATGVNGAIDTAGAFLSGCFTAAKSTIESIEWSDIGTVIATGVNGAIDTAGAFLSGCFDTAKGVIEGIDWANIGTTIANGVNGVIDTGGSFLSGCFEAAKTAIEGLDWAGLGQGIADHLNAAISAISSIGISFWNTVKGWFTSDENTDAKKVGQDLSSDVAAGMDDKKTSIEVSAQEAAKTALDTLKTELGVEGTTSTKTKPYGEAVVTGIKDGIEGKATSENLTASGTKVFNAVRDALKVALGTDDGGTKADKMKFAGEGAILGIKAGIDDKAKKATFTDSATSVLDAMKEALNSALGVESEGSSSTKTQYLGEGAAIGISDGIENKASSGTYSSSASSLASAAASALNTAFGVSGTGFLGLGGQAASKFNYIGEAISAGIANGITNSSSKITSAAKNAATAAYNAAKRQLGINSPSRAFAEIGMYCGLGMANGLKESGKQVEEAVTSLSDDMYEKMQNAVELQVGRNSSMFDNLTGAVNAQNDRITNAVDTDDLAEKIWEKAPNLDVKIDGQKAGSILEPHVSRNQGNKSSTQNRRNGNV